MRIPTLQEAVLIVVAGCAVAMTALVINQFGRGGAPDGRSDLRPVAVSDWRRYLSSGRVIGDSQNDVPVVEFADFQCPACRAAEVALDRIRSVHPHLFFIVFRHYPLSSIHPEAIGAAVASECAAAQGRFNAMHALFFQRQDSLGLITWSGWAHRAGVRNIAAFEQCVRRPEALTAIQSDTLAGRQLGVHATPTFLVHGLRITGIPSEAWFDSLLVADSTSSRSGQ